MRWWRFVRHASSVARRPNKWSPYAQPFDWLANYLDVLIAQRNLFDAELSLTSTHRLHLVSVVQLYKALGGGWSPQDFDKAAPRPVSTETGKVDLLADS